MFQFLQSNFGLPSGGLYSNLIASFLLGIAGYLYGRASEKRSKNRHEELKYHLKRIREKK